MINTAFTKTMEKVRKYRYITLLTTKEKRNYLAKSNYHLSKEFLEILSGIKTKKSLSILKIRKMASYEF